MCVPAVKKIWQDLISAPHDLVTVFWQTKCQNCTVMSRILKLKCRSCHLDGSLKFEIGIGIEFLNCHRISKLLCIYLYFTGLKRRMNFYWNHPTFYISWRCLKIHFTATLRSTTTKIFNIQHHFQHSTPYSNDMIHT